MSKKVAGWYVVVDCKKNFYHTLRMLFLLTSELKVLPRLLYLNGVLYVTLMYVYFFNSAHDLLPLNFPKKKKAGKITF